MPSCPPADTLSRLLVDVLHGAELADVESHVERCGHCQATLSRLARLADGPGNQLMLSWERDASEAAISAEADRFIQGLSATPPAQIGLAEPEGGSSANWDAWPRVDGYEIVGELGRGGMGVVYRARQIALGREVALKMVLAGPVLSPQARRRFEHEAQSIGRLHHPNVVQVFDVGEQGGRPFLAMELVEGGPLSQRLAGHPRPPRPSARLVEVLARAVHYAHQHGVVHRDLKPANILVGSDATADPTQVKITDFGLAKDLLGSITPLTQSGALLGTPSYMAPEQARGGDQAVGPPADVYALGAILYELLTGVPPFRAATPLDTLVQVVHTEPVHVNRLQPSIPRDLATICHKCLEKEPGRRYVRAADLADDLQRFLNTEPIVARPVGRAGRMWRWARRNPSLAGLAVLTAVVAGIALGTVLWQWQAAVDARSRADTLAVSEAMSHVVAQQERDAADDARRRAERAAVGLVLDRAISLCERGETTDGLLWLARGLEQAAATGAPDLEAAFRANVTAWGSRTLVPRESPPQGASITSVAFTYDGRHLLAGRWANQWATPGPGVAQLWDPDGWRPAGPALSDPDPVLAAVCNPSGHRILTASSKGAVRLWDRVTGRPIGDPLPTDGLMTAVAFGPDGRRFAVAGENAQHRGEAVLWDTAAMKPVAPTLLHPGRVNAVTFTPDGATLVTGCSVTDDSGAVVGGEVRMWDAASGTARGRAIAHADAVTAVAVSPDGRLILSGCADRVARLWDRSSGRPVGAPRQHPFPIEAAAFSPDGKTVFTGGGSTRYSGPRGPAGAQFGVLVWDAAAGKPMTGTLTHPDAVHGLAVRGDGRLLATACRDGRIRLYEVGDLRPLLEQQQRGPVLHVAFSPDGKYLLTGGGAKDAGKARLWDLATGGPAGQPVERAGSVCALAFDPAGRTYLTASLDGTTQIRDVVTGEPVGPPIRDPSSVTDVVVSRDSRLIATLGQTGAVEIREVPTGRRAGPPLPHPTPVIAAAFDPAGRLVATCCQNGPARLWDVATGKLVVPPLDHEKEVTAVAFSPDGRRLLTGGRDGTVRVWEDGLPVGPPRPQGATPWLIRFSKDGERFFTISGDFTRTRDQLQLWDAATAQPLGPPLPQYDSVSAAAFHPGGRLVAAGGRDGDVRLWDVATGRPVGPPFYHSGVVRALAFDPAGRRLAVAGDDGTIRVWPVPVPADGTPESICRRVVALTGHQLDASGAVKAVESSEAR